MIYKNIPHITVDGLNEFIREDKFIYCIIEEKIDGAPLIIGKDDDGCMYVQTGRSNKIYEFFSNPFHTYTKGKTDNPIRLQRAFGYDRSIYNIMSKHLSFFEKRLSKGDWIRYEMLSRYLTYRDVVRIIGADSLYTSIINEINIGGVFKPHPKINKDINNQYELLGIKYVNVVYPLVRFDSLVNLVEVDRSFDPLYKINYINDGLVSFYKNKQIAFRLPEEKESFLEFIQRFQILDELGVMSEGLIFKFFGTSEIKTYKLTTNYFKYLRQQK